MAGAMADYRAEPMAWLEVNVHQRDTHTTAAAAAAAASAAKYCVPNTPLQQQQLLVSRTRSTSTLGGQQHPADALARAHAHRDTRHASPSPSPSLSSSSASHSNSNPGSLTHSLAHSHSSSLLAAAACSHPHRPGSTDGRVSPRPRRSSQPASRSSRTPSCSHPQTTHTHAAAQARPRSRTQSRSRIPTRSRTTSLAAPPPDPEQLETLADVPPLPRNLHSHKHSYQSDQSDQSGLESKTLYIAATHAPPHPVPFPHSPHSPDSYTDANTHPTPMSVSHAPEAPHRLTSGSIGLGISLPSSLSSSLPSSIPSPLSGHAALPGSASSGPSGIPVLKGRSRSSQRSPSPDLPTLAGGIGHEPPPFRVDLDAALAELEDELEIRAQERYALARPAPGAPPNGAANGYGTGVVANGKGLQNGSQPNGKGGTPNGKVNGTATAHTHNGTASSTPRSISHLPRRHAGASASTSASASPSTSTPKRRTTTGGGGGIPRPSVLRSPASTSATPSPRTPRTGLSNSASLGRAATLSSPDAEERDRRIRRRHGSESATVSPRLRSGVGSNTTPSGSTRRKPAGSPLTLSTSPSQRLGVAAHFVPPENNFTPPKGADWDDVVLPTVARKLGLAAVSPTSAAEGEEHMMDEDLAVEWDKDGTPVRWERRAVREQETDFGPGSGYGFRRDGREREARDGRKRDEGDVESGPGSGSGPIRTSAGAAMALAQAQAEAEAEAAAGEGLDEDVRPPTEHDVKMPQEGAHQEQLESPNTAEPGLSQTKSGPREALAVDTDKALPSVAPGGRTQDVGNGPGSGTGEKGRVQGQGLMGEKGGKGQSRPVGGRGGKEKGKKDRRGGDPDQVKAGCGCVIM